MRVLQVNESLAVSFGGTAAACARLANHLIPLGVETSIVTFDGEKRGDPRWALDSVIASRTCTSARPRHVGYSADLAAAIESLERPDLIHLHGLWRIPYVQAARLAGRLSIPVIVSVNGMLHGRALGQNGGLKRLARWVYQDRLLRSARCLHATAPDEAEEIKRVGFNRPVAVIPWGVDMPDDDQPLSRPDPANDGDGRRVVYLGRLHASKGLDALLRAWSEVRGRFDGSRLVIAGYDEGEYGSKLMRLSSDMGIGDSVSFAGPVEGAGRERLFDSASVVVLPSPAENFGFVVPEALARGVPVIATHGAPWSSLADERCGWWVPYGVEPLAGALADALGRPPDELRAMGERGRRFVRARFAWRQAAASMVELYTWAIGRAPEPAFLLH